LQTLGQVSWELQTSRNHFFYLKGVQLQVTEVTQQNPAVPDGGATAMLLGIALCSLTALRRKIGC